VPLPLHPNVNPDDPLVKDFRNFLYVVFRHLRPNQDPTPAQYQIASFIQHGWALYGETLMTDRGRLDLIEAFRGVGKSEILAAYTLWLLLRNPEEEKVLILSATQPKSKKFVKQVKEVLLTLPCLAHLRPQTWQRDSFDLFDVKGASNTQSPSVQAQSVTGQITGDRASTIIADDVEIWENSRTEERRKELSDRTLEFSNIIYPSDPKRGYPGGDIIFLGTPQSEESIYASLVKERGYRAWVWPARYPSFECHQHYLFSDMQGRTIDTLAPEIKQALADDPGMVGLPTDTRFNDETLLKREIQGKLNWCLQYMLDTSVSDEARYPLKQRDFMVFPCNAQRAPRIVQWGRDTEKRNFLRDIPNWGFTGDYWIGPLFRSQDNDWSDYDTKVMYVDTSGRGEDETAWVIIGVLNGTYWVLKMSGMTGAEARSLMVDRYADAGCVPLDAYDLRMQQIAEDAKNYGVDKIYIESNFGDGLWMKAFQPILAKIWPAKRKDDCAGCSCEEIRVAGAKELRICDTLEPVLLNHRIVLDEAIARNDEKFGYQLTHMTRERNALSHEDRLDALAGVIATLTDALSQEQHLSAAAQRDELQTLELQNFIAANSSPPKRDGHFKAWRGRWKFDREADYDDYAETEVVSVTL